MVAVTRLEILLRFRAGRWRWLLVSWFAGLLLFTWLLSTVTARTSGAEEAAHRGAVLFGGLQLFMLALALFIVPALTSQSSNGDPRTGSAGRAAGDRAVGVRHRDRQAAGGLGTAAVFVLVSAP